MRPMELIWHGQNCFTLKGNGATVVVDPYDPKIGLTMPKIKADVVTMSHSEGDLGAVEGIGEASLTVFDWPGEYESKGILITLIATDEKEENLAAHFDVEGVKVCHLGNLSGKLSDAALEAIGDVDILLIPVGGGDVLDSKGAHEVIEQLEPRVVIPMHYKIEGLKDEKIAGVEAFLKAAGTHNEPRESFKIKTRAELPEETTIFVQLLPS